MPNRPEQPRYSRLPGFLITFTHTDVREDEPGLAGLVNFVLDPQFIGFSCFVIFVLFEFGRALLDARRRNPGLQGRGPRRAVRRNLWIYIAFVRVVRALWSAIEAFWRCTQSLIGLIHLPSSPAAGAAAEATAISPAALPQTQQSITEEQPQSQQPNIEEELQSHRSTIEEELQSPQSTIEDEFQSANDDGHEYQQPATTEGPEVAIAQESFLINIWNGGSLRQSLMNIMACFLRINHPIQIVTACSPNASHTSSPRHYEYTYGVASVNDENNDRHHEFKSLFSLDHGGVDIIDPSSLFQLDDMICQFQIVEPCYEQILYKVFADDSDVLDSFLCDYFNSAGLSIETWTCMDGSQFTYQSAKSCVMNLKVTAGLLCLMENELAVAECVSFHQNLKDCYFALCARRLIENLIKAADSISNLKWPASHIYQMLVLYEAIVDILRAFDDPNESDRIFQQMWVNFEGIFDGIKCAICDILNGSQCAITCVRHPATDFLVESMKLFKNHDKIVRYICAGDSSSSLGHLLLEVISYWAEELKKPSMSYTEGRNYIFLLNNLTHFQLETENVLQVLLSNGEHGAIDSLLKSLIKEYSLRYLEECWRPVRNCVELNSGRKPHWSSLNAFTSQFNAICNCQRTWVLQTQLKKKLREQIQEFITPSYGIFLKMLQKRPFLNARFVYQNHIAGQQAKHKTTQELESTVDRLFESEHIE